VFQKQAKNRFFYFRYFLTAAKLEQAILLNHGILLTQREHPWQEFFDKTIFYLKINISIEYYIYLNVKALSSHSEDSYINMHKTNILPINIVKVNFSHWVVMSRTCVGKALRPA
jgi:hypothetical protein